MNDAENERRIKHMDWNPFDKYSMPSNLDANESVMDQLDSIMTD